MTFCHLSDNLEINMKKTDTAKKTRKYQFKKLRNQLEKFTFNQKKGQQTPKPQSDLCDFRDAYIIVEGDIAVTEPNNAKRNKSVVFKNNAPFFNCISKFNGVQIYNADDLDVIIPMYNLFEYGKN